MLIEYPSGVGQLSPGWINLDIKDKVKVQDSAPAGVHETGEEIVVRLPEAHLVQVIGRTLVLYRPDPDEPEIEFP